MASVEKLREQFDQEEAACARAQRLIDKGGVIGGLVGRIQRWVHTGELRQITEELDVAELYASLGKERPTE
jgi:hypothetical protein